MNTNVYIHSYHKYFTILVSVLDRIYNLLPSTRACISDTAAHVVNSIFLKQTLNWPVAVPDPAHKHGIFSNEEYKIQLDSQSDFSICNSVPVSIY